MAVEKDDKGEVKPAAGQSLEDALKAALREEREAREAETAERKKRGEEAADLRKRLRAAEDERKEAEERRARESQKTLEEQGRFKDLYEGSDRTAKALRQERDDLEKKFLAERQEKDNIFAKLQWFEKRRADEVEARFAKLPEDVRKTNAESSLEVKEALAGMFERHAGSVRAPGTAGLSPPSGLGPTGGIVREEDVEAMTQQEREKFFKSPEWKRAVSEGRFVRKGQPGPR